MGNFQSDTHELQAIANVRTAYPSYKTNLSNPRRDRQFLEQYNWHLGYPEIDKYLYIHPKEKTEQNS